MPTARFRPAAIAAAFLLLTMPAAAQNYGQPSFPFGNQPGTQPGYQPTGPGPSFQPPGATPSLVGAWSGQSTGPAGTLQQADAFSADGRFVSVARLPNGFVARSWGYYRTTPIAPNQLRLELQLQGWLPREVCQQVVGGPTQCQPLQLPTSDTSLVTFGSPDQLTSASQSIPGAFSNETRDRQPALLQAQAPERWLTTVQPSAPVAAPTPVITPYVSPVRRQPATNIPGLGGNCDDLQQQRICNMNNGRLVTSGGCLKCVSN